MDDLKKQILDLTGAMNRLVAEQGRYEREIQELRMVRTNRDPYRIPDPIKSLPGFDGNKKQLYSWLRTAENTLMLFREVPAEIQGIYIQAVFNKLEGKARDIMSLAGEINSFEQLRTILTDALGDRQELSTYKCQLWRNRMVEDTTIHKYYRNTSDIVQNIKTLAKQNTLYAENWEAINRFIDEDALAAFLAGLRKPYFGHAQAARPTSVEEAYAFLCKYTSNEVIQGKTRQPSYSQPNQKPNNTQPNTKQPNNQFNSKQFNNTNNFSPRQQGSNQPKGNYTDSGNNGDNPEPMDIDKSLRSRMTYNKKLINNHEASAECVEPIDEADNPDEIAVNFWMAPPKKAKG